MAWSAPPKIPSTGAPNCDTTSTGAGASLRHGPMSVPYIPITPASGSPRVAARNDIRPPMQNPRVKTARGAGRSSSGEPISSTPATMSAEMPAQVVWATSGMWSKSSPRGSGPAVRPNQSIASASTPRSAKRSASSS